MKVSRRPASYSLKELAAFFVGVTGESLLFTIIGISLAYYLQFTLFIPASVVGGIMALARVWDGVNDVLMGSMVDKTQTRWGKARPYLIFSPFLLSLFTLLCFVNFGFYDPALGFFEGKNYLIVFWATAVYFFWELLSTMADVPLWGLTSLISECPKSRNRLLSVTRVGGMIGGGVGMMLVQPAALDLGRRMAGFYEDKGGISTAAQGERAGFILSALFFSIVGGLMFQAVGLFTRERIVPQKKTDTFFKSIGAVWKNKAFFRILLSGILGSPRTLLAMTVTPLISYYYAGKNPIIHMFFMALWGGTMFLGQLAAVALTPLLTQKVSKITVYNVVNIAGSLPYISFFLLYLSAPQSLNEPVYVAVSSLMFIMCGASNGFNTVLQTMLVADAVDLEEYQTGIRPDGLFLSGITFISKLSISLAAVISAGVYSLVGFSGQGVIEINEFVAGGDLPRLAPRYSPYMTALFFLVSIPPAIGGLLSTIPMWRYPLSDKDHAQIVNELNQKRQANEKGKQRELT